MTVGVKPGDVAGHQTTLKPESGAISATLDALRPSVPPAIIDLWSGWGYGGLTGGTTPEDVAADAQALRNVLGGVNSIVNALTGGVAYRVGLDAGKTAYTDIDNRQVRVTTAPLYDPRLTRDEALAVVSAMAVHEAGHGRVSPPMQRALRRAFPESKMPGASQRAHRLSNIVDDVRLEGDTGAEWPAYADVFDIALWWVASRYPSGGIHRVPGSKAEAINFAVAAIRYDHLNEWGADAAIQTERAWWKAWGQSAATQTTGAGHVRAIEDALDHISMLPDFAPVPEREQPEPVMPSDEDEADTDDLWGDDESEDDESDDDEYGPEGGLSGQSDEAGEADEDEPDYTPEPTGIIGHDEADDEADEAPEVEVEDDGSEAEADESDADGEGAESGGEDGGWGGGESDGTEPEAEVEHERDALSDPLPAHATEAADYADRSRDKALNEAMRTDVEVVDTETVQVSHANENGMTETKTVHIGGVPGNPHNAGIATQPDAQAALRSAFSSRRVAHDARDVARSGRISGHRAYKVRTGSDAVFTRRQGASPDRLDVHLLVDASGSMAGRTSRKGPSRVEMAAQMAANITEALATLQTVRVHVWAHNTRTGTSLWDVYDSRRGEPITRIADITPAAANNDASAIAALTDRIIRDRTSREQSVMVVISDGQPCEPAEWVRAAAETARAQHIGVLSVAIVGGLSRVQNDCYGDEWVVPWSGNWSDLAFNIARMLGQVA